MIYIGPDGRRQVHVDDLTRKTVRHLRRRRKAITKAPYLKNGTDKKSDNDAR
jgi:hypothetical protein